METEKNERLKDGLCLLTAVAIGLFAGVVDSRNNEPQPAAAILLVLCCMLAFARPRGAWRWGIIAPLGIPAVYLFKRMTHTAPEHWIEPNIFASLVALIPGLIGAGAGMLAGRIYRTPAK
jgi:hypothetical protein